LVLSLTSSAGVLSAPIRKVTRQTPNSTSRGMASLLGRLGRPVRSGSPTRPGRSWGRREPERARPLLRDAHSVSRLVLPRGPSRPASRPSRPQSSPPLGKASPVTSGAGWASKGWGPPPGPVYRTLVLGPWSYARACAALVRCSHSERVIGTGGTVHGSETACVRGIGRAGSGGEPRGRYGRLEGECRQKDGRARRDRGNGGRGEEYRGRRGPRHSCPGRPSPCRQPAEAGSARGHWCGGRRSRPTESGRRLGDWLRGRRGARGGHDCGERGLEHRRRHGTGQRGEEGEQGPKRHPVGGI